MAFIIPEYTTDKHKINFSKEQIDFIRQSKKDSKILADQFGCSESYIRSVKMNLIKKYYDEDYKPEHNRKKRVYTSKEVTQKAKTYNSDTFNYLNNLWFGKA